MDGGLETVCLDSRAGEGENGRDERGRPEPVLGAGEVGGVDMMLSMIGKRRQQL